MKKVLILGAGMVSKPIIDYFLDKTEHEVTIATLNSEEAENMVNNRKNGKVYKWHSSDLTMLDELVSETDIVITILPKTMHIIAAEACLRNKKNMVCASHISPEMAALEEKVKDNNLIFLNEIGEVPGLDHLSIQKTIDEIKNDGGRITSLKTYGSGIPAFESNNNPFGYKFSWSPKGLLRAANAAAVYYENGKKFEVPGEELFEKFWLVDIEGLGTFEAYPNKDSTRYKTFYGLEENVTLYRGLLRYTGWCNTMNKLKKLKLTDDENIHNYENITYSEFVANIINSKNDNIESEVAEYFDIDGKDDFINKLKWLGLFENNKISIKKGTNADVLVDLMIKKMSYTSEEKDMIIIHNEIAAEINNDLEKRTSTLVLKGIPNGELAMARAVGLPIAVVANIILEGKVKKTGVIIPNLPEIYEPALDELKSFGFEFKYKNTLC